MERLRAPAADLVISTSHCVAKGLRPPPGARHLCYCFTPMRYAWIVPRGVLRRQPAQERLLDAAAGARCATGTAHVRRAWTASWPSAATCRTASAASTAARRTWCIRRWIPDSSRPAGRRARRLRPDRLRAGALQAPGPGRARLHAARIPAEDRRHGHRVRAPCAAWPGRHVEFLGWRPDEEIRDLYRRCRLPGFPGRGGFRHRAAGGAGLRPARRGLRARRRAGNRAGRTSAGSFSRSRPKRRCWPPLRKPLGSDGIRPRSGSRPSASRFRALSTGWIARSGAAFPCSRWR